MEIEEEVSMEKGDIIEIVKDKDKEGNKEKEINNTYNV